MADRTNPTGANMISSILTIIVLLMVGACIGVGVIIAVLWFSVEKD